MSKIGIISLGCAKNQVDTESMLGLICSAGHELVEEHLAEIMVINTCAFVESAKQEAIEQILETAEWKKDGTLKGIIVTGCLSERYKDEIREELPEVDAFLGVGSYHEILQAIDAVAAGTPYFSCAEKTNIISGDRVLTTDPGAAYLRISDGCDNNCSYCAIPLIRGSFRSRPLEDLVAEAQQLAADGIVELTVIAQDTTRYGLDLYGEVRLVELLKKLCTIDGLRWIRLMYCYPERITDELIELVAQEEKIVKYFDIPFQHASGRILSAMNRTGDEASIEALCAKIRTKIPGVVLRTTFITGFPGEEEWDFEILCHLAEKVRFDRMGVFAYSREEGTPAADLPDQVDADVSERRRDVLTDLQMNIAEENAAARVGKTITVLIEGLDTAISGADIGRCWFGRSAADAPEVDPKIFVFSEHEPTLGEFVKVNITDTIGVDLVGKVIV